MTKPNGSAFANAAAGQPFDDTAAGTHDEVRGDPDRRTSRPAGETRIADVPVRDGDIEPARALHSVAILFRVLSGLLVVVIILQIVAAVTSPIDMSYGVLLADVIRMVIFAGLLWGAGDLADLFVTAHGDLRATRILLGRLTHLMERRD